MCEEHLLVVSDLGWGQKDLRGEGTMMSAMISAWRECQYKPEEREKKSAPNTKLMVMYLQKWEKTKRMVRAGWGWQAKKASWKRQTSIIVC